MIFPASSGIASIPHIDALIGGKLCKKQKEASCIVGWGSKRSGLRARALGLRHNVPALFLEDGFLRSFGIGDQPPLSLVLDDVGIYYDASRPSRIENLLNSDSDILSDIYEDVIRARDLILHHELSKYNLAPPFDPARLRATDKKRILIVDQTGGDLSISLGGANADSFRKMLDAARTEHPEATLYVKIHPEVASRRKSGHFTHLQEDERTLLLSEPVNPLSLIGHMDHVYVVSSTMGFEALLAGKPVTCFGMPWYAGWGVTDDRLKCPRRTRERSTLELFAAGYFRYARYLNPVTATPGTIFDVIEWLLAQREMVTRLHGVNGQGRLICVGYRRWKKANLAPILSLVKNRLHFVPSAKEADKLAPCAQDKLIWWGTEAPVGIAELATRTGASMVRMEDGFIRSIGLGSDLIPPLSIVLDDLGLYFDPRVPSSVERQLLSLHLTEEERCRARFVRQQIIEHGVTKYNIEPPSRSEFAAAGRPIVFVPGQVEDDASIRFGCDIIRSNNALLRVTRENCPDSYIIYKPHPDVVSGNRRGVVALNEARRWADHIETDLSVISCIEACDEVHTMTSLTGFDALIRGKRVVTYGQPFYAGWGLTEDRATDRNALARRTRTLDIDELIAGALLRYPLYWDAELKGFTCCEGVIRQIVERRALLEKDDRLILFKNGYLRRQARKLTLLAKACLSLSPSPARWGQ